MDFKEFTFTGNDGQEIHVYKWQPPAESKAVMLFVHGMQEYALRYRSFQERMANEGYVVYAHDQRGHGKTAGNVKNLGIIARKNGARRLVEDVRELLQIARDENPGKRIVVTGHSMGSFVVRDFISHYGNNVDAVILSGTRSESLLLVQFGLIWCKILVLLTGYKYINVFFSTFTLKKWCKKINNPKTLFDWLNRDEDEVKSFIRDEYCGFYCSQSFYRDLLQLLVRIYKKKNIRKIPSSLPILFTAGDDDPVGDFGKGVIDAYNDFLQAGLRKSVLKLYPGGRHEILKETNKEEVIADVLSFLNASLK